MPFKINSNPIVRRQTQKFLRAQKEPLFEFFLKKKKKNVKSLKLRNLITRRPKKEKTRKHEKRRKRQ